MRVCERERESKRVRIIAKRNDTRPIEAHQRSHWTWHHHHQSYSKPIFTRKHRGISRVRCSRKYRRNPLWSGSLIIITSIEIFCAVMCTRVCVCVGVVLRVVHIQSCSTLLSRLPSLLLKADDNAAYGSIAGVATPGSLPPSFHSILRFVRRLRAHTHVRAHTYKRTSTCITKRVVHVYARTVAHVFGREKAWSLLDGHRRRLAEIRPVR